jgi:hypothetical protein
MLGVVGWAGIQGAECKIQSSRFKMAQVAKPITEEDSVGGAVVDAIADPDE